MDPEEQKPEIIDRPATILLFDDDPVFRAKMGRMAKRRNVTIVSSKTYQEFKREFISKQPDVVVIEANPDAEHRGEDIAHLTGQIPVLIISGKRKTERQKRDVWKKELVLRYLNKSRGAKSIIDQALTLVGHGSHSDEA